MRQLQDGEELEGHTSEEADEAQKFLKSVWLKRTRPWSQLPLPALCAVSLLPLIIPNLGLGTIKAALSSGRAQPQGSIMAWMGLGWE